jgi:predicted peptidase
MHRIILGAVLMLLTVSPVMSQKMSLFDKLLFLNKGDTLPYRLLKPVNPESKDLFPLVIFLHGAGERGTDNETQIQHITDLFLDERNRGKYPCYLVAPQCPKKDKWANYKNAGGEVLMNESPTRSMQLVIDLIEKVIKEYPIDQNRIYITGLSMGGFGTWDLMARYPDKFAAAVPICGGGSPATAGKQLGARI